MKTRFVLRMRSTYRLTCLTVIFCILSLIFGCQIVVYFFIDDRENTTWESSHGQSAHGTAHSCSLPELKLWPVGHISRPMLPVCQRSSTNRAATNPIDISIEAGRLHLVQRHSTSEHEFMCTIFPILRLDDYISVYGEPILNVTDGYRIQWPHVMIMCQPWEHLDAKVGLSWGDMSPRTLEQHFICGAYPPQMLSSKPAVETSEFYNILLIGLDSMSRLAAWRHLPETMQLLESLNEAVHFQLYDVIGDGTTVNLLALLTGYMEQELPEARKSHTRSTNHTHTVLDRYPWIWDVFAREAGYATHYIEDTPKWGTFQHRLVGFGSNQTPTHSYGRPCMLAAEQEAKLHGKQLGCINSRYTHQVLLESMTEFFSTYANHPRFSLTFLSELIHEDPAYARMMDKDLVQLIRRIHTEDEQAYLFDNSPPMSNTIVILFADHGPRMGKARLSVQGKWEERLPLLTILLPKRLAHSWPEARNNLHLNQDRLVTLFDVHATLMHLLQLQTTGLLGTESPPQPHGLSLFEEIPVGRSCSNASIAPHWCACLNWLPLTPRSRHSLWWMTSSGIKWPVIVEMVSAAAVNHINEQVDQLQRRLGWPKRGSRGDVRLCSRMMMDQIVSAEQAVLPQQVVRFVQSRDPDGREPEFDPPTPSSDHMTHIISIHVILQPGSVQYEATARVRMTLTGSVDQSGLSIMAVSRLDVYEAQAWCVPAHEWPELRSFYSDVARVLPALDAFVIIRRHEQGVHSSMDSDAARMLLSLDAFVTILASRAGFVQEPWDLQPGDDHKEWASCMKDRAAASQRWDRARLIYQYLGEWDLVGNMDETGQFLHRLDQPRLD